MTELSKTDDADKVDGKNPGIAVGNVLIIPAGSEGKVLKYDGSLNIVAADP